MEWLARPRISGKSNSLKIGRRNRIIRTNGQLTAILVINPGRVATHKRDLTPSTATRIINTLQAGARHRKANLQRKLCLFPLHSSHRIQACTMGSRRGSLLPKGVLLLKSKRTIDFDAHEDVHRAHTESIDTTIKVNYGRKCVFEL